MVYTYINHNHNHTYINHITISLETYYILYNIIYVYINSIIYTYIKSLSCTPKTNTVLYVNYISFQEEQKSNKILRNKFNQESERCVQ